MPRKKAEADSTRKRAPARPRRKKAEPASRGLGPAELVGDGAGRGEELAEAIREDGGAPLAVYRDPLGGHEVVFAGLPIDKVEPTPYQRDVSETHVKRLAGALERVGRYLDPIVAVRHDGRYWTPNGSHRLASAKSLGMRSIVALVLPDPDVAYQILALNTEKAHNLKERSLEVIRMYRGLVGARGGEREADFAAIFEEPGLATLGIAYERRPRYSAGAYNPIVRRVEGFLDRSLSEALAVREERAARLLELDEVVVRIVEELKRRGMDSAYLKNYVVARLNPLRFAQRGAGADFDPTLDKMMAAASKFDPASVRKEDLARMGGAPAEAEE